MIKSWKAVLILPVMLALQGCPPSRTAYFYNHSAEPLTLILADREIDWPSNTSLKIEYTNNGISWNNLNKTKDEGGGTILFVEVRREDRSILRYKLNYVEFLSDSDGRIIYNIQFEEDGNLYAVSAESSFPVEIDLSDEARPRIVPIQSGIPES